VADWVRLSAVTMLFWGVVGLLQKLGTNRISSRSLLVWLTVGFVLFVPWLAWHSGGPAMGLRDATVGVAAGLANGLGSWFLFRSLERGAKASVAIPLTALYPLVTIVLATTLLAEKLTARQWLGIAVAVAAGAALSYETGEAQS
jgi:bacterial/archaeal transporter family protein